MSSFKARSEPGLYGHALYFHQKPNPRSQSIKAKTGDTICIAIDKVGVAHRLCTQPLRLGVLDLEERIKEIVDLIDLANL